MTTVDPREERLPVWTRALLADLRRELANAKASAERARLDTHPDESSAVLDPYDAVPVGLGRHARVRFKLNGGAWADVRVTDHGEAVEVMGGPRFIAVHPSSGNVVRITSEGR